ncbi:hypothetical protein D3C76_1433990 [compost metagenome]
MAEAFSFTLGTQRFAGQIQSFQRGVFGRVDIIDNSHGKLCWQLLDNQFVILQLIGCPQLTVDLNTHQRQVFTVQHQRRIGSALAFDFADGSDASALCIQLKIQVNISDGVIWRAIIVAILRLWLLCHKNPLTSQ